MTDPISDMLTRLRNAGRAFLPEVLLPHSKLKEAIAKLLKQEGYVSEVAVEGQPFKKLKIKLKYNGRKPVLEGSRRVSSPDCAAMSARPPFRGCGAAWGLPFCQPRRAS